MVELPKIDIRPTYEIRERFDRRIDRDLNRAKDDNKSDLLGRYRIGLDLSAGKWKGKLVYQVAEDECWSQPSNFMTERRDLIYGYAEGPVAGGKLTLGRQKLLIGTGRFVSDVNWNWVTTAYDVADWKTKNFEFFGGKVGVTNVPSEDYRLAGAVYRNQGSEALLLYNHDTPIATDTNRGTLDYIHRGKKGGLTTLIESAVQVGKQGDGDVNGMGLVGQVTYQTLRKVALFAEGSIGNAALDTGFGAAHSRNGLLDVQGWRNSKNAGVGLRITPTKTLNLSVDYHALSLNDATYPWYSSTGAIFKRSKGIYQDPTGNSGHDIGQELDFEAKWEYKPEVLVQAGLGIFRPGHFARSLGANREHTYGYVQLTYRF